MARRRREKIVKPPTFGGCETYITKMERAMIYRTVDVDFDTMDLLDMLVPPHDRHILREAKRLTQMNNAVTWDQRVVFPGPAKRCVHLQISGSALDMMTPHDSVLTYGQDTQITPKSGMIADTMIRVCRIMDKFDVVRQVVAWFNAHNVTPGAARYYFPAMGSLLPSEHAFHKVDGNRFKDVPFFPPEIADAIRKAPEIVAKALLCEPDKHSVKEGTPVVTMYYEGSEPNDRNNSNLPLIMKARRA